MARRQHTFLLLSLDVGTVRGSRPRERIRGHNFDRIAVLGKPNDVPHVPDSADWRAVPGGQNHVTRAADGVSDITCR
jgi:hypothetical protein